jgi:hypothetical protein
VKNDLDSLAELKQAIENRFWEHGIVIEKTFRNNQPTKEDLTSVLGLLKKQILEGLEWLVAKAKTFNEIEHWVMTPSERRSDPCGGAYDIELTTMRRESKWIPVVGGEDTQ